MVNKDYPAYLFIGKDCPSKDAELKKIKDEFLSPGSECFNLDVLYARELELLALQERLLTLPVKSKKRLIVIKDAQNLKDGIKEFILNYAKRPSASVILILDLTGRQPKDEFINRISGYAEVTHFKEDIRPDTFALSRQIEMRKADSALRLLNRLLKDGEKPERILGGLRYAWEKYSASPLEAKKRLKALLNCDIDIKTSRLRADFALEKLVVKLCGLPKPLR